MHAFTRSQEFQDVKPADLVAAIGRIGHAVAQKQDVAHQPRPREICGPTRFAIHSGSVFHSSTLRA